MNQNISLKEQDNIYNEIINIQLVLAEIMQEEPKVRRINNACCYSAISQMYANMILKGVYTLNKVPEKYIEEVDNILEKYKED